MHIHNYCSCLRTIGKMQATISQFFSCSGSSTAGQNDCEIDSDSDDGNDYPGDHVYKGMSDDEFDNDSTSGGIAGTEAGCVGGDSDNLPKTTAGNCTQECCSIDCDELYQLIINTNARRKQGQQQRSFQKSWFKKYKWLSFCSTRNAAFCFVCRKAKHLGMLTFNKKGDDAFTSTGFKNWKNALS